MGIVFRQSIKSTIVIAAGAVLGAVINLGYTYILTEEQAGYATIFPIQPAIFHIFVMFGLGSTILNFSNRYGPRDEKRKVLLTLGAFAPLIVIALLSIPYFIFRDEILQFFKPKDRELAGAFFEIVPLFTFMWSYMVMLECYLITQSKVAVLSFIREIVLRVLNGALLALFFFQYISFNQFIYGFMGSYLVSVCLLLFNAKKTDDFGFSTNWRVFNRSEYKEIFQYSWYHMMVTATLTMLGFVDTLLLGSLSSEGLEPVAVYGRAVFVVAIMTIPYKAMSPASIPTLNNAYHSGDRALLENIFKRSAINILIAATAMFVLIACNLDNLVAILPAGYETIKPVVLILMIGRMIDMSTGLNTELTSVSIYYKFNFRISILLLAMLIGFSYLLIPTYGIYGAAWGATIALSIFNFAKMGFLWWKMGIQPFNKKSFAVLICGAVAFTAGYFLPEVFSSLDNKIMAAVCDAVLRSAVVFILYAALLIWLKPSDDLNEYLKTVKANKRLF
jgi:O-antigen/teichoic acid export membrane protein